VIALVVGGAPATARSWLWTFDRLDRIGGLAAHVEGHPRVIDSPLGKAIAFNGVDDAIFLDRHPLAGAKAFTFEAYFRPDGGAAEQRWFHLQQDEPKVGPAANTRFLFEIRVVGDRWYLDAFVHGASYARTLAFPERLHPLGQWYHVAQTYDGRTYRSYVDGVLQGEAELAFTPQGLGHTSVGTRIDRRDYFRGAIRQARFTPRALAPEAFLTPPVARHAQH